MGVLFKLLGGKTAVLAFGGALLGLAAALSWHYIDKAAAVRSAERELADRVVIETQKAQIKELERRAAVAEEARAELEVKVAVAEDDAAEAAQELEEYEQATQINASCVVDGAVIERLRNR